MRKHLMMMMMGVQNYDYTLRVLATRPANLILYTPLRDASGTTVTDLSGNSRNGVYRNSPTLAQPGVRSGNYQDTNKCVLMDGINDFVNFDSASLCAAFNGAEGTFAGWVWIDPSIVADGASHTIMSFASVTAGNTLSITKSDSNNILLSFSAGSVSRYSEIVPATVGWHHIAAYWSYANNQARLFVDGVVASAAWPGGVGVWANILNHDKTWWGAASATPTGVFKGYFAHFALWDATLSFGEIYALSGFTRTDNTLHSRFTRTSTKSLYRNAAPADWLGRPVLCNNDGTWIMVYRQSTDHGVADANVRFHIRLSADEGVTWSAADTLVGGAAITGAPFAPHATNTFMTDGIILRAPNGDLLFQIFEKPGNVGTFQYRSTDDGATWTDEGKILADAKIIGGQDHFILGADIYITVMLSPSSDANHPYTDSMYKSTDNGTNWAKVANIDAALDGSELSVLSTGGNNLLCVARAETNNATYLYTSTDLGATWSARVDITSQVGVLQRPRLRTFGAVTVLYGREYVTSTKMMTVVYVWSGTAFGEKFYPDLGHYQDCGYCDILQRTGGVYYMLSYGGLTTVGDVKEYIWS